MNDKSLGVFCKSDKRFYYIEAGSNHVTNTIPRIVKTLISRGLVKLTEDNPLTTSQYEVFKIKDAKEKEFEIIPIFLSPHIKKVFEESQQKQTTDKWK
jgi:hypothetical protein